MGGLFSSDPEPPPRPTPRPSYYHQYTYETTRPSYETRSYSYEPSIPVIPQYRPPSPRELTVRKTDLHRTVLNNCYDWEAQSSELTYYMLNEYDNEYIKIKNLFLSSTKKKLVTVQHIERIQNPYLMGRYLLKKLEMQKQFGRVQEEYLFHGTKSANVDNISKDNFNWRLHGSVIGHKFGHGVSFSPVSYYASHYCDKRTNSKVMLVVQVLVANTCEGDKNMNFPPYFNAPRRLRYDTSQKEDGKVIVKYCDDEFYPAYKITFSVNATYYNKNTNARRNYHISE